MPTKTKPRKKNPKASATPAKGMGDRIWEAWVEDRKKNPPGEKRG